MFLDHISYFSFLDTYLRFLCMASCLYFVGVILIRFLFISGLLIYYFLFLTSCFTFFVSYFLFPIYDFLFLSGLAAFSVVL